MDDIVGRGYYSMLRKNCLFAVILLLCVLVLSSCGAKEFKFDDAITWHSTVDDIIAKYGEPEYLEDRTRDNDITHTQYNSKIIEYYDFNCCGYSGCGLHIYTDETDKQISVISVSRHPCTDQQYDDIMKAIISKYGNPSGKTDRFQGADDTTAMKWDAPAEDTKILLVYDKNTFLNILYYNTKYNNEIVLETTAPTNGI